MPDLTCLGKIIGGGLPVGAYGGKADIMDQIAPDGPVYQAGTLSGNPLAMAAGLATLSILKDSTIYESLEKRASHLFSGIEEAARRAGVEVTINRVGSMGAVFFNSNEVTNFIEAKRSNENLFKRYFRAMLSSGVYLAPSAYEAMFISDAHEEEVIEFTIESAHRAMEAL